MKHITILLFLIITTANTLSQESWNRIYSSGEWQIKEFYKTGSENSQRQILIKHNWNYGSTSLENGTVKKYFRNGNSWYRPAGGFLSTQCAQCVDPPVVWTECRGSEFFMISPTDSNFILSYRITLCAMCPDATTLITWNNGLNWSNYYNIFGVGGTFILPNGGDFDPTNNSVLYYGFSNTLSEYQTAIFKSTNRGMNWQMTQVIPDLRYAGNSQWGFGTGNGFIAVSPLDPDFVFANHRDYLMRSTDAGNSFSPTALPALKELVFDVSGNRLFGIISDTIYTSTNNGTSWTIRTTPVQFNTIEPIQNNANVLFAGSDNGLHRSTNGGQSWHLYNNTFAPSKKVIGICRDPDSGDTLIVCTLDAVYKVFRDELTNYEIPGTVTPVEYVLYQNYPNPFNPATLVRFNCPFRSHVSIKVYDALGRLVSVLFEGVAEAGYNEVQFNTSHLSSGIYLCRMKAGDNVQTIKMTVTK